MSITSLSAEVGVAFVIAYWGAGLALGFKADPRRPLAAQEAIQRCFNWAVNTGVTKGGLSYVYDESAIGYVCTTHEDIMKGLIAQFRAEIIMAREVPPLVDEWPEDSEDGPVIEYDEPLIESMATARAQAFLRDRVTYEPFLANTVTTSLAPVYGLGSLARVAASDE
jgi:hypothetical protein